MFIYQLASGFKETEPTNQPLNRCACIPIERSPLSSQKELTFRAYIIFKKDIWQPTIALWLSHNMRPKDTCIPFISCREN